MEKKTIIAQVDNATGQLMKDISEDINNIIDDNLKNIKENTEDIIEKLDDFDGLSSSLEDLKEFAEESRKLAKTISPIESQLANIQNLVIESVRKNGDKTDEIISSVKEKENKVIQVIAEGLDTINKGHINMLSDIKEVSQELQKIEDSVVLVNQRTSEIEKRIRNMEANIENIAQQNASQLNALKESVEKIQATLDIVVNLTTPFWKKWGK